MRIEKAAILVRGEVFSVDAPGRHVNIIESYVRNEDGGKRRVFPLSSAVEGFLTNAGQFVTREEAAKIAYLSGQIDLPVGKLRSEDVW
jgi:hypothetical protein